MSFFKEFREFAVKGNMIDLATGVIIGTAFGNVVNSIVADLVMPVVGRIGDLDFSKKYIALSPKITPGMELTKIKAEGLPAFAYGNFLTVTLNFLIVAFCVFLLVKIINTARRAFEAEVLALAVRKEEAPAPAPAEAPAPPPDIALLTEIRDLLKKQQEGK